MTTSNDPDSGMRLRPTVHVEDMPASVAFYEQLGARVRHEGTVELNFEATEPLDALGARLCAGGVTVARSPHGRRGGRWCATVTGSRPRPRR